MLVAKVGGVAALDASQKKAAAIEMGSRLDEVVTVAHQIRKVVAEVGRKRMTEMRILMGRTMIDRSLI
jgi:hypothetical protein